MEDKWNLQPDEPPPPLFFMQPHLGLLPPFLNHPYPLNQNCHCHNQPHYPKIPPQGQKIPWKLTAASPQSLQYFCF